MKKIPDPPYVAVDIEIADMIAEFNHWRRHRPLTITCIATSTPTQDQVLWSQNVDERTGHASPLGKEQVLSFARLLWAWHLQGTKIITWNGLAFDLVVIGDVAGGHIMPYLRQVATGNAHVDIMFNIWMTLGYTAKLDSAAEETVGESKMEIGGRSAHAPQLWAECRHQDVMEYCKQDARITRLLYEALLEGQPLKWRTRGGAPKQLMRAKNWDGSWSVGTMLTNKTPAIPPRWMKRPFTLGHFLDEWRP